MHDIVAAVGTTKEQVGQIAGITGQQALAMDDIAQRVSQVIAVASKHLEHAVRMTADVENLAEGIGKAREVISGFRLPFSTAELIQMAKMDHALWRQRLRGMLLGKERVDPARVASERDCRLGLWYYGDGARSYTKIAYFQRLEEPHRRIHRLAQQLAQLWKDGKKQEAEGLMEEVVVVSGRVLELLDELLGDVRKESEVRGDLRKVRAEAG